MFLPIVWLGQLRGMCFHGACFLIPDQATLFQNVEEVVVLKEAHGAVSHLQMISSDRLHDSLEETRDQRLHFLDLAHLEHLLQLGEEEGLLDAVGEWPVLEQALEKRDSEGTVLGEEEHGATEQLLVELAARLHLV